MGSMVYFVLWMAYWCGKYQLFDGGAEETYRRYWVLQANGEYNDDYEVLNWEGDRQMLNAIV